MLSRESQEPTIADPTAGADEPEREISRRAALITLARLENYRELWAETEQAGDELFLEKTRELWKDLVVHGKLGVDLRQADGEKENFIRKTLGSRRQKL